MFSKLILPLMSLSSLIHSVQYCTTYQVCTFKHLVSREMENKFTNYLLIIDTEVFSTFDTNKDPGC